MPQVIERTRFPTAPSFEIIGKHCKYQVFGTSAVTIELDQFGLIDHVELLGDA